jgi:hypothetical protein
LGLLLQGRLDETKPAVDIQQIGNFLAAALSIKELTK